MKILAKYPDRIPVICEEIPGSNMLEKGKKKFLLPNSMNTNAFKDVVLSHISERAKASNLPVKGLSISIRGQVLAPRVAMKALYDEHKAKDGFLYAMCSAVPESSNAESETEVGVPPEPCEPEEA